MKRVVLITMAAAAVLTACGSGSGTAHYGNVQDIANKLKDKGFTVSAVTKDQEGTDTNPLGATYWNFTVSDKGKPAGDAGINMFPSGESLAAWVKLSKSFGGVAVTGDRWAVSLPTDDESARSDSLRLAPKVADALGGTVQK